MTLFEDKKLSKKSPISWLGGKTYHVTWILEVMKAYQHNIYVEVFGGSGAVLFGKQPVQSEIYNDIDSGLVNFFRVLADPEKYDEFYRRVALLPYSRELYNEYRKTWKEQTSDIIKAVQWYYIARQSFAGQFAHSWGYGLVSNRGMNSVVSRWLSAIDRLADCHNRLQRVLIENNDYRKIITAYDSPETLFYLDPPYIMETRKSGGYTHEIDDSDHKELVDMLLNIEGAAVLSGYKHTIYDPLIQAGWNVFEKECVCLAAGTTKASGLQGEGKLLDKQKRTEILYCSPEGK